MRLERTNHFVRAYRKAPVLIQRAFDRKVLLLVNDLGHPSLHAKKFDEARGLWQARVSSDWRFYFTIESDAYVLHELRSHPK